jgi:hypothetical protein
MDAELGQAERAADAEASPSLKLTDSQAATADLAGLSGFLANGGAALPFVSEFPPLF